MSSQPEERKIPRNQMMFIIYVSIFGVIWGIGTSILAGALPPDPVTRGIFITWFEVTILFLTKLVIRHPLSVTFALLIASTISIFTFTFSFGPPNPYKPLFVFSGLAFDAGTMFRTKSLRYWNLILGLICYITVIYPTFYAVIWLIDSAAARSIFPLIPLAASIYLIEGIISSAALWSYLKPGKAPDRVKAIWREIGQS